MSAGRISTLLCASLAFASAAAAEDASPVVVQLRLPARSISLDVFAWRTERGVEVETSTLAAIGIETPSAAEHTPLSSIPGLSYDEQTGEGAIMISCTLACYTRQRLNLTEEQAPARVDASANGGYVNYEVETQWIDEIGFSASAIAQVALFGRWGLLESSWVGQAGYDARLTRLDTTWTIDSPSRGVRTRIGDSVHTGVGGAPVRFAGVQVGRYFGLEPSLITYPTPTISAEAESASTVELYVDGVLRAQSAVQAGPFVIDQAPVVSGGGETQLVITDILGRQQVITRSFFVSTSMLRQGLSDWSIAAGAQRQDFGRESARYGDRFAAARYRYGLTGNITVEGAFEASRRGGAIQAGTTIAHDRFGQLYLSQAVDSDGGFSSASWYYDGRALSLGLQFEQRQGAFLPLGRDEDTFRLSIAGNASLDMGNYGAVSVTGAEVRFDDLPDARTFTLSYTPDFYDGSLSFRVAQIERENRELVASLSFSFTPAEDVTAHASVDSDDRGVAYRAGAQRAAEPGRIGWRARATVGSVERADLAAMLRGPLGDTQAEASVANGAGGARVRHAGSVGWIDGMSFAGRRIDGAFALVDTGVENVSLARNHLDVGETGQDGRRLVTNLRPYDRNLITISADDLPLDRAPETTSQEVTPAEGAGVVVRFSDARERIMETRVAYADGATPPRGGILVRVRDGERFPIGSEGRIVLQGARNGDVLALNNTACSARADEDSAEHGLILECAALS